MKNKIRSVIAIMLVVCLSAVGPCSAAASGDGSGGESQTGSQFDGDGFSVDFVLQDKWNGGFNATVRITNTGDDSIENWILWMNYQGLISYSWNADMIVADSPEYTFKNAVWNQDIAPGESVEFGINGNEDFAGFPSCYQMLGEKHRYSDNDYELTYSVQNEWGSGFTAEIRINNKSEKDIEDWILEFDYDRDITNIWNGEVTSRSDGHYVIKNCGYNSNISPGGVVYFGFNGAGGGSSDKPRNIKLYGYSLYDGDSTEIDTDLDGIPDGYEKMLGCDYRKNDTDGDGLDDKYEIEETDTNPLKVDTDGNGTEDAYEDPDGDGVDNEEEYMVGTNPQVKDSDGDGLDDFQELHTYVTDPLAQDTDGDTLSDYDDVKLGFNPLMKDSDQNGVSDDKEILQQTLEQPVSCAEKDEVTKVAVSLKTNGNLENTMSIDNMYGIDQLSSDVVGLIGVPVEINTSAKFDKAELSFYYDADKLGETNPEDLRILWYDKENNIYRVLENSEIDTGAGRVYAETTHFSTYMVVDSKAWYGAWKENIDYTSGEERGNYEVSFVMDVSGSMAGSRMQNAKAALNGFIDELDEEDTANLITFSNSASVRKEFTSDKEDLKGAVRGLSAYGGTNVNAGLLAAIKEFKKSGSESNRRLVLMLCDGDVNYYQSTINTCKDMGISIYSVNVGSASGKANLDKMARETGGEYYYCRTSSDIEPVFATITQGTLGGVETTDTDGDGLYDVYEIKGFRLANGRVIKTDPFDSDTDDDGLTDYEETGIVYGKTDMKGVMLLSDPTRKDTDNDGVVDPDDEKPWTYDVDDDLLIYQSMRTKEENEKGKYAHDIIAGDKSIDEIKEINLSMLDEIDVLYIDSKTFGVDMLYHYFERMVKKFSRNDLENVVLDMISTAREGHNREYSNDTLTDAMREHSSTIEYVEEIKNEVCSRLSRNNGNVKSLEHTQVNINNDKCIFNWVQKCLERPKYNKSSDIIDGLKICVDDTWANTVSIRDYNMDGNRYYGKLHFCIYDHFGLDESDVEGIYGNLQGFRSWYVLQHYDMISGVYTPLITVAEFDVPFEGIVRNIAAA